MSKQSFEELVEDYARTRVPEDKTVNGFRVALIQIGVAITLPAFLTGSEIGQSLGLSRAALAFVVGGLLLAVVGGLTGSVGAKTRLSTPIIIQFCFGTAGAKVVNSVMAISLFGWFGINVFLFGEAVQSTVLELGWTDWGTSAYMLLGSFLMISTTIFGFKALDKLSLVATPALFVFLIFTILSSVSDASVSDLLATSGNDMSLGLGISAVVGAFMVGATVMPDFCRYVHSPRHAVGASVLSFGVGFPAVLLASAIPTLATGEGDFMRIVLTLSMGILATGFLVFATWTTNSSNLYSNALVLVTIFRRAAEWKLVLGAGTMGTILALTGIMDHFVPFLLTLGIALPPIGGIFVADFFLVQRQSYNLEDLPERPPVSMSAILAWLAGFAVGYGTANRWFTLTAIPAFDSLATSFLLYLALQRARRRAPRLDNRGGSAT